jgi:hypothetical protein
MKQTRLLEIIREEIAGALGENEMLDKAAKIAAIKAADLEIKAQQAKKAEALKGGVSESEELEEDTLNEMAYNIVLAQPDELTKLQAKIKDSTKKGEQLLAKVIEIIQRDKKEGKPIRQRDISNELGIIQQKVNPLINILMDYGILEKGESVTGVTKKKVTDKSQGRPTKEKSPKEPKIEKSPKAEKTATLTPGDDGFDDVSYSDDEEGPSAKDIAGDETAKELGNTPEEKKLKFNQFLASVKKNKDDKAKIDGILKIAKDKFKFSKQMMDDLKRSAGRDVQ